MSFDLVVFKAWFTPDYFIIFILFYFKNHCWQFYLVCFCLHVKIWKEGLRKITHNNKMNNVCPRTNLMKQWVLVVHVLYILRCNFILFSVEIDNVKLVYLLIMGHEFLYCNGELDLLVFSLLSLTYPCLPLENISLDHI